MGKQKFFTKDDKVRPITKRKPHIGTLSRGSQSLSIPRRTKSKIRKPSMRSGDYLLPPPQIRNGIEWGFDLTGVRKKQWQPFLEEHQFKLIDKSPSGSRNDIALYRNPSGIFMVVEHHKQVRRKGHEQFLGYMRFEAPKSKRSELTKILQHLRGDKILRERDVYELDMEGGIATYVKEESPHKAQFI